MLSTQEKKNIPSNVFSEFRNARGELGQRDLHVSRNAVETEADG